MYIHTGNFGMLNISEVSEGRDTLTEGRHEFNFEFDLPLG